ncbi:MAG: molybdopterin-binding protein [Anaerolineaceae bacterium]|nr:molybdopterin-binding protein [Anaerolineaceae bacterium]
MKFGPVPIADAVGCLLAHRLVGADGRSLFVKGHLLSEADCARLAALGYRELTVARLEADDLGEDEAARRIAEPLAGDHVSLRVGGAGRATLHAECRGVLRLGPGLLERLNMIDDGITIATLREHSLVDKGEMLALVKVVPFAIPAARVQDAVAIAQEAGALLAIRPLRPLQVTLILSGPAAAKERLQRGFVKPVQRRVEALGCSFQEAQYCAHETTALAETLRRAAQQADLLLVAGISAIIDRGDVVPSALERAGGSVTHFGVPVDPGTLLMLGYLGDVPVVGAPGCVQSPKTNVIDWLLPRLVAGERLTRSDLLQLGHGGLLEEIPQRPLPRSRKP